MLKFIDQIEWKFRASKKCLLIISVFCLFSIAYAQPKKRQVSVEDLRYEWMVSSNQTNSFTRYVSEIHAPTFIHIAIDLNRYSEYHLSLTVPDKSSLFIENEIVYYQESTKTIYLSIDSLKMQYQNDEITLTIFSKEHLPDILKTSIVDLNPNSVWNVENVDFNSDIRSEHQFKDFNILSILMVVICMVIIRTSQSPILSEYFSLKKIFTLSAKSEVLYSLSLFSASNLSILLFYGVVTGFSLTNLITWLAPDSMIELGFESTLKGLILGIILSLVAISLIVAKFILLKLVDSIFLFRKATSIHFYEYLRFTNIIALIVFIMVLFNNFSKGLLVTSHITTISWMLLFLLVGRSIFVFLKLNKLQSFRKLHLFSYLCSTEIIPLIILIKIFKTYVEVF